MNTPQQRHTERAADTERHTAGPRYLFIVLLLSALFIVAVGEPALAINTRIKGKIVDESGAPLKDVQVQLTGSRIKGKPLNTATNKKGTFFFIVETGDFVLLAEKEGYRPNQINLSLRQAGTKSLDITLESLAPAAGSTGDVLTVPESALDEVTASDGELNEFKAGIRALEEEDLDSAETIFRELLSNSPQSAKAHYYLGMVLISKQAYDEAAGSLGEALRLDPGLGQAHLGLGRVEIERGNDDAAQKSFEAAAASGSVDIAMCAMTAANLYIQRRDYPHVIHYLEQYNKAKPGDAEILYKLGSAYFNEGQIPEAVEAFEESLKSKPDMVEAMYQLALGYLNQGRTEDAVAGFKHLIETAPEHPLAATAQEMVGSLQ